MNGKELFCAMSFVHSKYIQEAEDDYTFEKQRTLRFWKRPLVIAAIIGLTILLMGSAVVVRTILAESDLFDYELVDPASVDPDDIHLTVSHVSATSMRVYCEIEGVEYGVNSIYILANGPFAIEKYADESWQPLESKISDELWRADEVLTEGSTEWYVNWTGMYGILEPGTYRYVATVLEGNVPVSVEFTVEDEGAGKLQDELNTILEGESYHIRYTDRIEFGSKENLTEDGLYFVEHESATYTYDFVKSGDDLLELCYRDRYLWTGIMYKDGIKYQIDHVDDDRTMPVIGWSPWPGMDRNDLTGWIGTLNKRLNECEADYSEDGTLELIHHTKTYDTFNSYVIENTNYKTWEIVSTDPVHAAEMIAKQDVNVAREFSWEDDRKNLKSLDVAYVNTTAQPVNTASEAIARAMAECTVEHDKILCYRDEEAGMWKVEFQIMYGYQGYQFIYLNDEGITQMVSGAGSKEPAWRDLYPDP